MLGNWLRRPKNRPMYYVTDPRYRGRDNFPEDCHHCIPFVLLLCIFIFWWFCRPGLNLDVKAGRRAFYIPKAEKPIPTNGSHVHIAYLAAAAASPSHASVSHILMMENKTAEKPPVGTNPAQVTMDRNSVLNKFKNSSIEAAATPPHASLSCILKAENRTATEPPMGTNPAQVMV